MGPLTPAVGDLVATPRGYKSLALEGFSEDLNEDGFVDPIAQAAVPVATYEWPSAPVAVQNVVGAGTYTIDTGEVSAPAVHAYTHAAPVITANVGGAAPAVDTYTLTAPAVDTYTLTAPAVDTYTLTAPSVAVYSGFRGSWRAPAVVNLYLRPQAPVVDDESEVAAPRPAPLPTVPTVQHVGYNFLQPAPVVTAPVVGATLPINQQPVIYTGAPSAPAVAAPLGLAQPV